MPKYKTPHTLRTNQLFVLQRQARKDYAEDYSPKHQKVQTIPSMPSLLLVKTIHQTQKRTTLQSLIVTEPFPDDDSECLPLSSDSGDEITDFQAPSTFKSQEENFLTSSRKHRNYFGNS